MIDYSAIKKTSESLQRLLQKGMAKSNEVDVTICRPGEGRSNKEQMNLFLFHVEENKYLKNDDNTRLWLDLYYLLTPYPIDETFESDAQATLGDAMSVFHEYPIIDPELKVGPTGDEEQILDKSLKGAVERIKITPHPMTLDEVSKIWTPLKGDFRLSVAYHVSVVQIDVKEEERLAAPVRVPSVGILLAKYPEITMIEPQWACAEWELRISGRNFLSKDTTVEIEGKPSELKTVTDEKITLDIPSDIRLGPQPVQVVVKYEPEKDRTFSSNQGGFIVVPMIDEVTVESRGRGRGEGAKRVVITGTNLCDPNDPPELETTVLIGEKEVKFEKPASRTKIEMKKNELTKIESELEDKLCLLRVRVDGFESRGKPCDRVNEMMWFYDGREPDFDKRFVERKYPEDVLNHG